jgi:hypothetical protein
VRDYEQWLQSYDDPDSGLSWRLRTVQAAIGATLDRTAGPVRVVSACAGDGRDVIGVLAGRPDADRVSVTLIELHPGIAGRARAAAVRAGLPQVQVRTTDAGSSDAYAGAVPADLVLLVGVFGNIDIADLHTTIAATPQLCAPGATLIWTRGRGGSLDDRDAEVRVAFRAAGFTELEHATDERGHRPAVGVVRYDGPPVPLEPGRTWFTFRR